MNKEEINQWLSEQDLRGIAHDIVFVESDKYDNVRDKDHGIYDDETLVPDWALCTLVNGDEADPLGTPHSQVISELCIMAWQYQYGVRDVYPQDGEPYGFTDHPEFGLGSDVTACSLQLVSSKALGEFREHLLERASSYIQDYQEQQ